MFIGVEMDPESGSINNPGSVFVEPTLKKAVKHMKQHLTEVINDRTGLSGVNAHIIDTDRCLVVVYLSFYGTYAQLEAACAAGDFLLDEVPSGYYKGIKIDVQATRETCDIEVFKKFTWE